MIPLSGLAETARVFHAQIDRAVEAGVRELESKGLSISCGEGCAWCCYLPVRATLPECALAAAHIKETFAPDEIEDTVTRVEAWLEWSATEIPRLVDSGLDASSAYMLHGPGCPFLLIDHCAIYPVRPMGCRVHCSTSDPRLCAPSDGSAPSGCQAGGVDEVLEAAKPVCMDYRRTLEGMGLPFGDMVELLPVFVLPFLKGGGMSKAPL